MRKDNDGDSTSKRVQEDVSKQKAQPISAPPHSGLSEHEGMENHSQGGMPHAEHGVPKTASAVGSYSESAVDGSSSPNVTESHPLPSPVELSKTPVESISQKHCGHVPGHNNSQSDSNPILTEPVEPWHLPSAYRKLKKKHANALAYFLPIVREIAIKRRLRRSEELLVDAVVRALVSYRGRRKGKGQRKKFRCSLKRWVFIKVGFAIRDARKQIDVSGLRDAFLQFEAEHGSAPDFDQLCKISKLTRKRVVELWPFVLEELEIEPGNDPLPVDLFRDIRGASTAPHDSATTRLTVIHVREILSRMSPAETCLCLLRHLCGYSIAEILEFLGEIRQLISQNASTEEIEALLDEKRAAGYIGITVPWGKSLAREFSDLGLRLAISRAKKSFTMLYFELFPDCYAIRKVERD